MKTVFADTVYWVALLMGNDPWAQVAESITRELGDVHLATTEEVLTEFLAAISRAGKTARRVAAERVFDLLEDEDVTVYPQSHASFLEGLDLYTQAHISIFNSTYESSDRHRHQYLCGSERNEDVPETTPNG